MDTSGNWNLKRTFHFFEFDFRPNLTSKENAPKHLHTILYEEDLAKSAYKPKYELKIFNCPSIFLATY
jgi:hypothetical protein